MRSKQHRLMISGSFLALSTILLLATLTVQASATHKIEPENTFKPRFPPKGSLYAINILGTANIAGKSIVKPVSVDIELKVVSVKTRGVPSIFLELTAGKFSLGKDVYVLEKGTTTIPGNKVNIKATSKDGTKILTVFATLGGPLPVSTSEDPVKLVPALARKSASIQVLLEKWILKFGGNIDRIA